MFTLDGGADGEEEEALAFTFNGGADGEEEEAPAFTFNGGVFGDFDGGVFGETEVFSVDDVTDIKNMN